MAGTTLGGGFYGYNALTQPLWQTASSDVIGATLAPVLTEEVPIDASAQRRYRELQSILNAINPGKEIGRKDFARRHGQRLARIRQIVDAGPLQPVDRTCGDTTSRTHYQLRSLAKAIQVLVEVELKEGRTDLAAAQLTTMFRLADRIRDGALTYADVQTIAPLDTVLYGTLTTGMDYWTAQQNQTLLNELRPAKKKDLGLRRAVRNDLDSRFRELLPDPALWISQNAPQGLGTFIGELTNALQPPPNRKVGVYDPVATAEELREIGRVMMANAVTSRTESSDEASRRIKAIERTMPFDSSAMVEGSEADLRRWQYEVAMRRLPNSFGKLLIWGLVPKPSEVSFASYRTRTNREAVRALVGLRIYSQRFGKVAPSLDSVVKAGILPALPYDFLGDRPLRYDPIRHRLWSVGRDALDENGTSAHLENSGEPDWIWATS